MGVRAPAVAGYFYPDREGDLVEAVDGFMSGDEPRQPAVMAIVPHAGYVYSGLTAGRVLSRVKVPKKVILLGPKHHRRGARCSVSASEGWRFPFGTVPVDGELAVDLAGRDHFVRDDLSHEGEHSLEVIVPFLWRSNPSVSIVPVALGAHSLEELQEIGRSVAEVAMACDQEVLVVASTDMSHQLPEQVAAKLDSGAIDRVVAMDPRGLYDTVLDNGISMCGVMPVTAGLCAAKLLGGTGATLVEYTSSARASGDTSSVVGYAGFIVS